MLDLSAVDVQDLADALADQALDGDHAWLIDSRTGQILLWTSDAGIDGENPVELDELDEPLVLIELRGLWFPDTTEFADGISDQIAGRRLGDVLGGRGSFHRFADAIHRERPELITAWNRFRDVRAQRRAVEWLLDSELIAREAADAYFAEHPDPTLP